MKKLYLLSIFTLSSIAIIYSCSTEEEDNTPPPSLVATPEPEPPAPTQYTLTVTAGEGGSVSTEGGTYDEGTDVTITATADEGYKFIGWEGINESNNQLTITINSDISLTANFELDGLLTQMDGYTLNSFVVQNPNQRKIDLTAMLDANASIFVYHKEGYTYLIVPGVSDLGRTDRSSSPRGRTFVFYKDINGWSNYSIEEDNASSWIIRNFDYNEDFFILGDANEIGSDWQNWKGDIIKGTPSNGQIEWERINEQSQMGFFHDVSIGNVNSDNIPDILGVGFKVFLGNNEGYDFIGSEDVYGGDESFIEYRFNRPLALELFDFDGDGIDEIVSADYNETYGSIESNRITIHQFNGEEEIYKEIFSSNSPTEFYNEDLGGTSIQVSDINNDGHYDILVARESSTGESFESWINNGNLTFKPQFSKKFDCNEFNFLEFEMLDVNGDGNQDVILRPQLCGGVPTNSFLYSSYSEDGNGIKLNDCIWLNDGAGNFSVYTDKELRFPVWVDYLYPYMENDILHFVGFEFESSNYNQQNQSLPLNVLDIEINLD